MSKIYKSTNYIVTIKNVDKLVFYKELKTYKNACDYVKEILSNYQEPLIFDIHRIAETFHELVESNALPKRKNQKQRVNKIYNIEEIHALFNEWDKELGPMLKRQQNRIKTKFDGYPVKTWSDRYDLFRKNTECVKCGLKATHYRLERDMRAPHFHFNLYGLKDGEEILFTKDHIIPSSIGGKDCLSNYQTMCYPCNSEKADNIEIKTENGIQYLPKQNFRSKSIDLSRECDLNYVLSL